MKIKQKLTAMFAGALAVLGSAGLWLLNHDAIAPSDVVPVNAASAVIGLSLATILAAVSYHVGGKVLRKYNPGLAEKLSEDDDNDSTSGTPSGGSGLSPALLLFGTMTVLTAGALSSCSNFTTSGVTGTVTYDGTGRPVASLLIPLKDSTGKVIGTSSVSLADGNKPKIGITFGTADSPPAATPSVVATGK